MALTTYLLLLSSEALCLADESHWSYQPPQSRGPLTGEGNTLCQTKGNGFLDSQKSAKADKHVLVLLTLVSNQSCGHIIYIYRRLNQSLYLVQYRMICLMSRLQYIMILELEFIEYVTRPQPDLFMLGIYLPFPFPYPIYV